MVAGAPAPGEIVRADRQALEEHAIQYEARGYGMVPVYAWRWVEHVNTETGEVRTTPECVCGQSRCHSPGKHPIGGPTNATFSAAKFLKMFDTGQRIGGIGIATGSASGIFVLDEDKPGSIPLDPPLPDGPAMRTQSGMAHYWFQNASDLIGRVKPDGLPGIDGRGEGNYVVVAPSIGPQGQCEWLPGFEPWAKPLEPLPAHLAVYFRPDVADLTPATDRKDAPDEPDAWGAGVLRSALTELQEATEGSRRITCYHVGARLGETSAAGHLPGYEWCLERARAAFPILESSGPEAFLEDEAVPVFRDGWEKGQGEPKGPPPDPLAETEIRIPEAPPARETNGAASDTPKPTPTPEDRSQALLRALEGIPAGELADMDLPEVDWVLEGICAVGHATLWAGRPKAGKTHLLLRLLSDAVLNRASVFGYGQDAPRALYLTEDPLEIARDRLREAGLVEGEGIRIVPLRELDGALWNAQSIPKRIELIAHAAAGTGATIVVVDTSTRWFSADETDQAVMDDMAGRLGIAAKAGGFSAVIVHHARKSHDKKTLNIDDIRGASSLAGAVDNVVIIQRNTAHGDDDAFVPMTLVGEGRAKAHNFILTIEADKDGALRKAWSPNKKKAEGALEELASLVIQTHNDLGRPLTPTALKQRGAGGDRTAIRDRLTELERRGHVRKVGEGFVPHHETELRIGQKPLDL